MSAQSEQGLEHQASDTNCGFPFALSDGAQESRYLTWVRNHSNYMAVRGFLDYMRITGVLIRGILLNFLIFLPVLLVIAIGLAYGHHWMLAHPFLLTGWTVSLVLVSILLFPITVQLIKILMHQKSLKTGSDSSVKWRDRGERLYGALLLLALSVALFEALPWLLEYVDDLILRGEIGWQSGLAAATTSVGALSAAGRLLSRLKGAKKTLAMGAFGLLGLIAPLGAVLVVTRYLLYGFPPSPTIAPIPMNICIVFVIAILVVTTIGVIRRSLRLKELVAVLCLLLSIVIVLLGSLMFRAYGPASTDQQSATSLEDERQKEVDHKSNDKQSPMIVKMRLQNEFLPVVHVVKGLVKVENLDNLQPEIARLLPKFRSAYQEYEAAAADPGEDPDREEVKAPPSLDCPNFDNCLRGLPTYLKKYWTDLSWDNVTKNRRHDKWWWDHENTYFSAAAGLHPLLADLLSQPDSALMPLRAELVRIARDEFEQAGDSSPPDARESIFDPVDETKCVKEKEESIRELETAIAQTTFESKSVATWVDTWYLNKEKDYNCEGLYPEEIKLLQEASARSNDLLAKMKFGRPYGGLPNSETAGLLLKREIARITLKPKAIFVAILAVVVWLACWLTVDINLTAIHGLYRDRLATAFLVKGDGNEVVDIEADLDLHNICQYDTGSTAPYHLINTALNLQASKELRIRDRQCDFFVFSKRYVGGARTGYCRSETLEQVFPQMSVATAMAISAAAASPNMGKGTSPLLVAIMTLLNVRLGFWMPNPGLLEETGRGMAREAREETPGFSEVEVLATERAEIELRWSNLGADYAKQRATGDRNVLTGLAFSGGGIRSAAINLGIVQALERRGVFEHMDYLSTVSGGGYLGSSISTLMRSGDEDAQPRQALYQRSEITGTVSVERRGATEQVIRVTGADGDREHLISRFDRLSVTSGDTVSVHDELVMRRNTIAERFRWRVRPIAFIREMLSKLDEKHRWVNLSDGGHIENLGAMELLRRRCKYIIVGDGEADPKLHFSGLATLLRYAYLDMGVVIDINVDDIRLNRKDGVDEDSKLSDEHWTVGTIKYPQSNGKPAEQGYLLYLKSSYTGDESELIREYRHRNPAFPHQTTADQFFDEAQFEAYRALGQHIADRALNGKCGATKLLPDDLRLSEKMTFEEFELWFDAIWRARKPQEEGRA